MVDEAPKDDKALKLGEPIEDSEQTSAEDTDLSAEAQETSTDEGAPEKGTGAEESEVPRPSAKETSRGVGFVPLVIGGVIAGGIGFASAQFLPNEGSRLEEVVARVSTNESAFSKHVAQFEQMETALQSGLDGMATADQIASLEQTQEATLSDLSGVIQGLRQQLDNNINAFDRRLTELEKRPISDNAASTAAVSAYERELTAMRETLEAQRIQIETVAKDAEERIAEAQAQAEALKSGAEAAANATLLRASLTRIEAAFESGTVFDTALEDLAKAAGAEPPAELVAAAGNGVAPLTRLQSDFPAAARAALSATAIETSGEGAIDKIGAFLKAQTGARSLTPLEGDNPDAILSRAEANLRAGDLNGSLSEISTLPDTGQAAMAEWTSAARYRLDVMQAVRNFVETATQN